MTIIQGGQGTGEVAFNSSVFSARSPVNISNVQLLDSIGEVAGTVDIN
jgi:hypothetical protein